MLDRRRWTYPCVEIRPGARLPVGFVRVASGIDALRRLRRLQNCKRLTNWNYAPLLLVVFSAVVVVYAEPIALLIERVLAAGGIRGLLVVPALVLVLFALLLHQKVLQAERDQQVKQETEEIAGDARRAEERARELEQLVRLGEALGATLDPKAIHQTVIQYLQPVVGQREIWMTVRTEGWKLAIGGPQGSGPSAEKAWDPTSQPGAWDTFPMFAGGKLVGLMGVGQTVGERPQPLSDGQRRVARDGGFAGGAVDQECPAVSQGTSAQCHRRADWLSDQTPWDEPDWRRAPARSAVGSVRCSSVHRPRPLQTAKRSVWASFRRQCSWSSRFCDERGVACE